MKKNNIKLVMESNNQNDKQQLLADATESTRIYVKTGRKSELCKSLMRHEEEIKEMVGGRYNEITTVRDLSAHLEENMKFMIENMLKYIPKKKQEVFSAELDRLLNSWILTTTAFIEKGFQETAYAGYLSALCEINEIEEEKQREEKEFKKIKNEIPQMVSVSYIIETNRRMSFYEVPEKCKISLDTAERLFRVASSYFIISKHKELQKKTVSLSPKGKRFVEFTEFENKEISRKDAAANVALTCESMLSSLQSSMRHEILCDIQIYGVQPQIERKIKHEYRQVMNELLWEMQKKDSYDIIDTIVVKEKPTRPIRVTIGGGDKYEFKKTHI